MFDVSEHMYFSLVRLEIQVVARLAFRLCVALLYRTVLVCCIGQYACTVLNVHAVFDTCCVSTLAEVADCVH